MLSDRKECTIKEVCEYYGVTNMTVTRWKKRGLPYLKRGRSVFFVVEDLEKWIAENNKVIKINYDKDEENPVN